MTTVINGTSTSASAPAVVGDDGDTGLYFPSANEVAIATAGSQKAYFGEFGYLTSVSTTNSSLTLKKGAAGADGIDYLQLRDSSNNAKMVITGAGNISSFGGQITFPASANLSSNANTLDDYEEGSWTPTLQFGGASTGITYLYQSGTYVKIGRQVTAWATVYLSNKGSSTGDAQLTGLPFAPSNTFYNEQYGCAGEMNGMTFSGYLAARAGGSNQVQVFQNISGGSNTILNNSNFSNGTSFAIAVSYTTNS